MATFIALYRGETVPEAKLVAVSAEPELIMYAATKLLQEAEASADSDLALELINQGRQSALRIIRAEVE